MINYQSELEYFNNTHNDMNKNYQCDQCGELKEFLTMLLQFDNIEDIATYYQSVKGSSSIIFPRLEEDLKTDHPLEDIKTRIVICAIDRLLKLRMPN